MIEILAATPLSSVQDLGRSGVRRYGIGVSGAMDPMALSAANLLLGNERGAAGIEITASPLRLRFLADTAFSLCGADGAATLDGLPLPPFWAMAARAGQELSVRAPRAGMRAYLAVAGGIDVPVVMGSRSTDLKTGFGGHEGRGLAAGDRLPIGTPAAPPRIPEGGFGVAPPAGMPLSEADTTEVRVIRAAQYGRFPEAAHETFWSTAWTLRPDSNRMGFRLAGPALIPVERVELLSHGILPGVVQVPPAGEPMIQLNDANTCGGYPKMGVVIGADLWRLGQLRLGGGLRFAEATREEALAARAANEAYLAGVSRASRLARRV
ncbi:biotin-dependent carboxyltransferase family protein [Pseudoroseomonas oryzae]|uniref:Biotin-dependent carboxyltransferase family protein n=2 Tax=Teichococcus oryzae TaxID=1608942 RepID=A0A5B2TFZ0_9PROT|nr:biotin-dependent carboxyltransferase family protein [Pseudoroseomonas oryzae]